MSEEPSTQLPANIAKHLVGISSAFIPATVKALDRLVADAIGVPSAWLRQKGANIDAQTKSYSMVENAIARTVATSVPGDAEIIERALENLVRKEYRKQKNREAAAVATLEVLREGSQEDSMSSAQSSPEPDDEWLNVYGRFAEQASTERAQNLWGRVLAGQIRQPGRFSLRALRFLSEFSQEDAEFFEKFSRHCLCDFAPRNLVKKNEDDDISESILLESSGLIQGGTGIGFKKRMDFDENGKIYLVEDNICLLFTGEPHNYFKFKCVVLTAMAQELMALITSRDRKDAARRVAFGIKNEFTKSASISVLREGKLTETEVLWSDY